MRTGACQQPAGDDRPNTVDLDQLAAGRGDRLGDLSGENLQPLVCLANLCDQVTGELLAGRLDRPSWPDAGQQPRGDRGGQAFWSATRQQIPKHCMQLIDQPGPLRRDVRAPLIEQGKHRGDVLGYAPG